MPVILARWEAEAEDSKDSLVYIVVSTLTKNAKQNKYLAPTFKSQELTQSNTNL